MQQVALNYLPFPLPHPLSTYTEKCCPSGKNLAQTLHMSLVHKPLFGEGCLWSCPQLLCCTEKESLEQLSLNENRSVVSSANAS